MFQVTDRAAQRLKTALAESDDTGKACLRMAVADDRLRLVVDEERPGDTGIEHEGELLLVMDPVTVDRLHNRKLDYEEGASSLVLKLAE